MAGCSSSLIGAVLFFCFSLPLAVTQCPDVSVSVNTTSGSLIFRPLSSRSTGGNPDYDPGAIGGWYSLASGFIEVVRSGSLPYDTIKDGLRSLNVPCSIPGLDATNCTSGQSITTSSFNPSELISSFVGWLAGLIVVTLIGGILAFSFLVCGCCFWCCRCCGNCGGGKSQKVTDSTDCKTFTFTGILLIIILLLFVGVVLAFFSNEQTFRSLDNLEDSIHTVTGTGANFINHTLTEIEELLCQLAAPRNSIVTIILDEARGFGGSLNSELARIESEVVNVLGTLDALPEGLASTIGALSNVTISTQALLTSFAQLQSTLLSISSAIDTILFQCQAVSGLNCSMIPSSNMIQTAAEYNALPNVTSELDAARRALEDLNIRQSVEEGRMEFDRIRQSITTSVDEVISNVTDELQGAVNVAHGVVSDVITAVRAFLDDSQIKTQCPSLSDGSAFNNIETNINNILSNSSSSQIPTVGYIQECIINQGFDFLQQYDVYRYAFGIVICSMSLITIVFVLVGVLLGMIGFRKNVDTSERSPLSHCGGIILLIGVTVTFVLGFLLMILTALMFFFGASAQKLCNSLEAPEYPLFAELIDDQELWGGSLAGQLIFKKANPSATDAVLSAAVALRNCERNEALFSAFNLSNLLPAGSVKAQLETSTNISQVQEMVDNLNKDAAGTFNFTNSSFLPDQTRMSVNEFVDANVQNISIIDFQEQLNKSVLAFDANQTAEMLNNFRITLSSGSGPPHPLEDDVNDLVSGLISLTVDQIPTILNQVETLASDVEQLERVINNTVMTTVRVADKIEGLINNLTGPTLARFLDNTVGVVLYRTVGYISDYINHLESTIERNVSRCQPLWLIYSNTYNSVCGVFLDGLNGFWWSLGFCSVLFIPVIIFSIVTSTCYLRKQSEKVEEEEETHNARATIPMEPITIDEVDEIKYPDQELSSVDL